MYENENKNLYNDLKQTYYSTFFRDSSFSHDISNKNPKYLDSYDFSNKNSKILDKETPKLTKSYENSPYFDKNPIVFMKCQKHPMFDLVLICTEKKCNFSPAICKICLTDTHLDHNSMSLTDFLSRTKNKLMKLERVKELKFLKIKGDIQLNIENLCSEYSKIINTMKIFIDNIQAKFQSDFNFFWKSLQEYPPFKFMNIIKKIENNGINTIRVLNSSLNYLLDYDHEDKKMKNVEIEQEIEENFNSIFQNINFNEDKLKRSKEKIEDILNSINLDKLPIFHSNYLPKNDSMLRNEGISESRYLEDIIKPGIENDHSSNSAFDDELTKFTQSKSKKVTFNDFSTSNSSFLFKKLPLSENKKFFNSKTIPLHKAPIFNITYLNDLTSFVSASADHTIKIYDLRSNKLTNTLYSHSGPVNDVIFLRKNDIFATSSADTTIKLWSSKTCMIIKSIEAHEIWVQPLISICDENILVSGGGDEKIKLWDISTGKCLNTYEHHKKGVNGLTSLDDKSSFISYSYDNSMTLWDSRKNKPVLTYKNDGDFFNKVIYVSDGDILIAGFQDGMIKFFMKQNLMNYMMKKAHIGACNALEYFYDGQNFVSGGEDGMIKFWNLKSLEIIENMEGHKESVQCLCYMNNGKSFLSGSVDKTVKVWELMR